MGIDRHTAAFLVQMRDAGVAFGRVLTLGRQMLYLERADADRLAARLGTTPPAYGSYAEPLFAALGAVDVVALDASSFEQAALIHDLNEPVPAAWHEQYDLVFDGGTLEHVFHFPTALASVMRMLRPGGRLVVATPSNSWAGHGFYQFSPELYWRALAPANGFSVVDMILAGPEGCFRVAEPAAVRNRVELASRNPATLLVHGRRDRVLDVLAQPPQQSDYVVAWSGETVAPTQRAAWKMLPVIREALQWRRHRRYLRERSFANRGFYTRVDLAL